MQKRRLLALVMLLLLALPVCAFAAEYKVETPSGYSNSGLNYPVIYLMPQDGYAADNSGLLSKLKDAEMLIVRPVFTSASDVKAEMNEIIDAVDSSYRTIADKKYRAIVGTGVGGYLAYAVGLADNSQFGFVASTRGDFVSADNPWVTSMGDVQTRVETLRSGDKEYFNKIYTYMDAPVEDAWTNMKGSSNDMGSLFIGYGTTSWYHEFTVRPGKFDSAFLDESASRLVDRLQSWMYGDILTGSVKPVKATLTKADKQILIDYTVNVSDLIKVFASGNVKMRVRATVTDDSGKLGSASAPETVAGAGAYSGRLVMDNVLKSSSAKLVITAEIMGAELEVASTSLVLASEPVISGKKQAIDLMGDWHFIYVDNYGKEVEEGNKAITKEPMTGEELMNSDYESWPIVQPGFSNWCDGYGNIVNPKPGEISDGDFRKSIVGSGYYAKTFTLPANFTKENIILSIGKVDDRCEVYVNGHFVGATGMKDHVPTGETAWAIYSYYDIDPSILNYGGENVVFVRAWNDTSGGEGGWYDGPIGLYNKEAFDEINPEGDSPRFYEETYYSEAVGATKEYLIYLPKSYSKNDRYYPTLYLLHQFNSDHTSYRTDNVDKLFDEAMASGMFDEMIVVIPNSNVFGFWKNEWERMVTEDLIPHIEENYRAIPDARYRLTAGCSMGGQGAMSVALTNPNTFSGIVSFFGAFSQSFFMGGNLSPLSIADRVTDDYLRNFAMYFICGNQDSWQFGTQNIQLNQKLQERGIAHRFFIENGEHNSAFYVPYFKEGIAYARDNMYKMPTTDVQALLSASYGVDEETGELLVAIKADPAIAKYFNKIPDSSYTEDTDPGVTVPVIVTVTLKDAKARGANKMTFRTIATFDDDTLRVVERFQLPAGKTVSGIKVETQLLGGNNTGRDGIVELMNTIDPDLPETGDESNLMMLSFMMLASVAALIVINRRKATC